jgi:hypothetical protein
LDSKVEYLVVIREPRKPKGKTAPKLWVEPVRKDDVAEMVSDFLAHPAAESQASDQTVMSIAGHVSREMLEHYSHVRLEAKRRAVEMLSQGGKTGGYVTNHGTKGGTR